MDDLDVICTRQPADFEQAGEGCPACRHPVGLHGDQACPLCAIIFQAEAITLAMQAQPQRRDMAAPVGGVLRQVALHMGTIAGAVERAMSLPPGATVSRGRRHEGGPVEPAEVS